MSAGGRTTTQLPLITTRKNRASAHRRHAKRRIRNLFLELLEDRRLLAVELVSAADPILPPDSHHALLPDYSPISDDGRYIAFWTEASNVVPNDTNGLRDVFLRDTQTGTTYPVSVNSASTATGNSESQEPAISADPSADRWQGRPGAAHGAIGSRGGTRDQE